ncbi:hypothetical protein EON83_10610 [bacterium]|nr:MAG: hypothetical protein EON83_10610 [bacterium]
MNCSQCQERLDEQLDELRPGLRSGALSSADARLQAQQALTETLSDCAECEGELRAHLNMRLSLMLPDPEMASVAVPPALRANVRRALERESAAPAYVPAPWKPLKGFAWTGGMLLSAVLLFVVARPFLESSARKPLVTTNAAPAEDSFDSTTGSPGTMMAKKGPTRPQARKVVPAPAKPKGAVAPPDVARQQQPSGVVALPPLPQVGSHPEDAMPSRPSSSDSDARPTRQDSGDASPKSNNTAPRGGGAGQPQPVLSAPKSQPPVVASSTPVSEATAASESANDIRARSVEPVEPRLAPDLVAPSGPALGLVVRFVPSKSLRDGADAAAPRANLFMARPNAPVTPQDGAPPAAMAPPAPIAPAAPKPGAQEKAPTESTGAKPPPRSPMMMRRGAGGGGNANAKMRTNENRDMADANANAGTDPIASANANASSVPVVEKGTLSVAVKEPVANARVMGQVQGREGEGIILWSGNAAANKPISVPLEPLKANKGDTINITFQQQVSLGEVKTLATTTVTVP